MKEGARNVSKRETQKRSICWSCWGNYLPFVTALGHKWALASDRYKVTKFRLGLISAV